MLGRMLRSRYRLIQNLGQGGFGKTYLAEDIQLQDTPKRLVKQLHPTVNDPQFLEVARRLFTTEAETLKKLGDYDHIPELFDYFEEDREFYLVQEFIVGHDLSQELPLGRRWSEANVVELLQDCLDILEFIHSHGVIHRDIKPDNLIRRHQDNKLVLVDFGTVKQISVDQTQLTSQTVAVGTRGYMPPEQVRGKPRISSDIYALGILCIQALTGANPIDLPEDADGEIVWQSRADVSPELAEILSKMVRYNFKDRYQSVSEVVAALQPLYAKGCNAANKSAGYTPTAFIHQSGSENSSSNQGNVSAASSSTETPIKATTPIGQGSSSVSSSFNSPSSKTPSPTQGSPSSAQSESPSQFPSKLFVSFKSFIQTTMGVAILVGIAAMGGMYFLNYRSQIDKQQLIEQAIANLESKYNAHQYEDCFNEAESLKTQVPEMPDSQRDEIFGKCGLAAAEQQAAMKRFSEAIDMAVKIPETSSTYLQVQQRIEEWSNDILEQARQIYLEEGKLKEALEMVDKIPPKSAIKTEALEKARRWQEENQMNQELISTAQALMAEKRWQEARDEAYKVSGSAYWLRQANDIVEKADNILSDGSKGDSKPEGNTDFSDSQNPNNKTTINVCPGPLCNE